MRRWTWAAALTVAGLAFVFRWPSCGESFWLDELHSAWTVNGPLAEVAWRAGQGNQTGLYFHALWGWSRLFGTSEAALRASSVLASCLAAGLLVLGVRHRSGSLAGGVVAGTAFAIDPHAVFFGCELRPYAWLMPCAVTAVWALTGWLQRPLEYGSTARVALVASVCLAGLLHPTSLGVLGWLPVVGMTAAVWRRRWRWGRGDVGAVAIMAATAAALYASSLPDSWRHRELWRAFGQARHWESIWFAWDYTALLMLPTAIATVLLVASMRIGRGDGNGKLNAVSSMRTWGIGLVPGLVAVVATCCFFLASYSGVVPLWHRRYFIAALPLLCWTSGASAAASVRAIRSFGHTGARGRFADWIPGSLGSLLVAAGLIGFQAWDQGTLLTLASGRLPLQLRGEGWRAAVAIVERQMRYGDRVWLDSGLIEANVFRLPVATAEGLTERQQHYLGYPLAGPYRLPKVTVVASGEHPAWLQRHVDGLPERPTTVWLISRSSSSAVDRLIGRLAKRRGVRPERVLSGIPGVYRLDFGVAGSNR